MCGRADLGRPILVSHFAISCWTPPPVVGRFCVQRDDSVADEEGGPMDREAELRQFVSARGAALSRAAYLLTGDHHAAEDLVQEAYVTLVRRWQKSGTLDPEAYVRRI